MSSPPSKQALTVSIIIPAYNEERHLKACLDAVAAQIEMPDEVIVVDNNSSDNTDKIAGSYPFVRVVTESKQGVLWARNAGFNAARCGIIGRIDADTVLPPDWVRYIKYFYKDTGHANHALTGGAYFYNLRFPNLSGWFLGQIAFRLNRLLMGHYITYGANMAVPARAWQEIRRDVCKDPHIHEDLDLSIHLHRAGYEITYKSDLRVGVKMRRVLSERKELWGNLMWWPRTLRRHGKKTWVFGFTGAAILYALSPLVVLFERVARLFGARSPE